MICQQILSASLSCQTVQTPKGEMQYVSLPYHLSDGACLGVYIINQGGGYLVSDDGSTLFKILCNGIDLTDRRRWQPLRSIVSRYGYSLSDTGTIRKEYPIDRIDEILSEVLLMMAEVVNWDISIQETGDFDLALHSRVEELLTMIYHKRPETNKQVIGPHGAKYTFDFYADGLYIDAFKPHPITTGARLRKLLDLGRMDGDMKFMMVIDDRDDPEKAQAEMGIFTSVATATTVSLLEQRASMAVSTARH